ncbi:hemolysin III family protein [uncultured Faecalibaculum sp.]|uniref:PAQR family membrane homeostasis protein TrhA n=1 Tax=uncultured Faecalibaculum sp. TaxID=1729681 RepID=UPI00260BC979|nr:hemolysin III family protein [uncultured Faecalibaculum sp.]
MKHEESKRMDQPFRLSFGEEVGNAISHGVMMFALLFTLPYYAIRAYLMWDVPGAWGISIYFISMMFMFGTSCLYHIMPYGTPYKSVFRRLDHMMILLAIAGTYTPICLVMLNNWIGWTVLAIEWSMVLAGILLKSLTNKRLKALSLTIYMIMGWLALAILPTLLRESSWLFLFFIVLGGVMYTIGVFFYNNPQKRFFHFTWHIFIVLASICHLIAILYFM